ncbi:hypothetical protein FA10DRAFT_259270 [Acaromyces ingoldii]|uniref:BZIP domain-containing protein n=1 Tax=Acaromyces ingoldii TaxID=215250 RepID=A0A316YVC0_9BASI|nr:hypothetical protein FA10DRAFT_259270 [Acaromyces ingoldii]PWN92003.1 hypothetical protein FA10DRAFT_259270 [Acaromyces ingoldii]
MSAPSTSTLPSVATTPVTKRKREAPLSPPLSILGLSPSPLSPGDDERDDDDDDHEDDSVTSTKRRGTKGAMTPERAARLEARAHRNRLSAQNSRNRKKMHVATLEKEVVELKEERDSLKSRVKVLEDLVHSLLANANKTVDPTVTSGLPAGQAASSSTRPAESNRLPAIGTQLSLTPSTSSTPGDIARTERTDPIAAPMHYLSTPALEAPTSSSTPTTIVPTPSDLARLPAAEASFHENAQQRALSRRDLSIGINGSSIGTTLCVGDEPRREDDDGARREESAESWKRGKDDAGDVCEENSKLAGWLEELLGGEQAFVNEKIEQAEDNAAHQGQETIEGHHETQAALIEEQPDDLSAWSESWDQTTNNSNTVSDFIDFEFDFEVDGSPTLLQRPTQDPIGMAMDVEPLHV